MSKSIPIFGVLLLLGMAGSWVAYTGEKTVEKEGIPLVDVKKDAVEKITYASPDADVLYEVREDALGKFGWVTVTEHKVKKAKEGETPPPPEVKVTKFKAGDAGQKLVDSYAPLMAMRELQGVDDKKLDTFGLKAPDTRVVLTAGGRESSLEIGGEVYGPKDRYIKDGTTGKFFILDDELIKPLKFAATRLPERGLMSPKPEEIDTITLGAGNQSVSWTQKNKDDPAAKYWERSGQTTKDETFANWAEKALKLKSQSYVQEGAAPTDLQPVFDLTVVIKGQPAQTVHIQKSGEDWFAQSEFTRGLVKLTKGPVSDAASEVQDILEGRTPPPKEKPKAPAGGPPGRPVMPPGMSPGGGEGGPPGMPMPPRPPGGMPPGMMPKAPPTPEK